MYIIGINISYITAGIGQLTFDMLKPFKSINHPFPKRFFKLVHAIFELKIYAFGIQPPVEPQDEKLTSIYN